MRWMIVSGAAFWPAQRLMVPIAWTMSLRRIVTTAFPIILLRTSPTPMVLQSGSGGSWTGSFGSTSGAPGAPGTRGTGSGEFPLRFFFFKGRRRLARSAEVMVGSKKVVQSLLVTAAIESQRDTEAGPKEHS